MMKKIKWMFKIIRTKLNYFALEKSYPVKKINSHNG